MFASINRGWSGSENDGPIFEDIGLVKGAQAGYAQASVRLADIDGDGRIDYCVIAPVGDIYCWRNGGQGDAPTGAAGGYWQALGLMFTGKNKGNIAGTRFIDINGDVSSRNYSYRYYLFLGPVSVLNSDFF
jgi:hypothetical protein